MKKLIFKSVFATVAIFALNRIEVVILPMFVADASIMQLQDSDTSYVMFKGIQDISQWFFVLYILPLLVFVKDIKKAIK